MTDVPEPSPFHVLARTTLADDRIRVLKDGELFGLFDRRGDIHPPPSSAQGLYYGNTRFLNRLVLLIDDHRPLLLGSTVRSENAVLVVDMSNPDIEGRADAMPADTVHVCRTRFLSGPSAWERLVLHNHSGRRVELKLSFLFGSAYEDVFEIRGRGRERRGVLLDPEVGADRVVLGYRGLDDAVRRTDLFFEPKPDRLTRQRAEFRVRLEPAEHASLHVTITCSGSEAPAHRIEPQQEASYNQAIAAMKERMDAAKARSCRIRTSSELFDLWLDRSFEDLHILTTDTAHGPYPYAGIPWFATAFGRDGIITALQRLWCEPDVARGVLRFLAAHQSENRDDENDAEPGKILHETRTGEMAALGEVPFRHYYGTIDATPLFAYLTGACFLRTGDRALLEELWPNVEQALRWIERDGDQDGDGFVEYGRRAKTGLVHQGWKDSDDAVFHDDGADARAPIALCEVQAYAYGALRMGMRMAKALGLAERARDLGARAERLRQRFEEVFWIEDQGIYALALDGEKRRCEVRASNMGHCLLTGIVSPDRAARVAEALLAPDMFSGWGVRTLSSKERRYNPLSYHNGSVWPHDNSLIGLGLSRYGFRGGAARILDGMFAASTHFDLHRLPELFCGLPRRSHAGPVLYPVACEPQAWAAGTVYMLIQASLGLSVNAVDRTVTLTKPCLPQSLKWIELRSLRVADAEVDLRIVRHDSTVAVEVLRKHGDVRIEEVQ